MEFRLNPPVIGDTLVMPIQFWGKHEVRDVLIVEDWPHHYVISIPFKEGATTRKGLSKHKLWKRVHEIKRKGS